MLLAGAETVDFVHDDGEAPQYHRADLKVGLYKGKDAALFQGNS